MSHSKSICINILLSNYCTPTCCLNIVIATGIGQWVLWLHVRWLATHSVSSSLEYDIYSLFSWFMKLIGWQTFVYFLLILIFKIQLRTFEYFFLLQIWSGTNKDIFSRFHFRSTRNSNNKSGGKRRGENKEWGEFYRLDTNDLFKMSIYTFRGVLLLHKWRGCEFSHLTTILIGCWSFL